MVDYNTEICLCAEPEPNASPSEVLKAIIEKAGLSPIDEFVEAFKKEGVNDENIQQLNLETIEKILGKYEKLHIYSFHNSLTLWKIKNPDNNYKMIPTGFNKYTESKHLIDIEKIMMNDLDGKAAVHYYKDHKNLDAKHRSMVINVIVKFLLQNKIWVQKSQFQELSNIILNYFNSNNKNEKVNINII